LIPSLDGLVALQNYDPTPMAQTSFTLVMLAIAGE